MAEESVCIGKEPCPSCGSRDNLGRYSDGHAYCFTPGCDHYEPPTDGGEENWGESVKTSKPSAKKAKLINGDVRALAKRGITEETCQFWDYRVGRYKDRPVQIANYKTGNKTIWQKVRFPDKDFTVKGDSDKTPLYGQWLWRDKGKMLVITEGEIDALSVSQLQNNKWPVVSIPKGAKGAARAIRDNIEWIEGYDRIVFMFDMDEAGQLAAEECAILLTPGKAAIARLPLKDANEMLVAKRGKEVIDAIWGAREYRPDGIVSMDDLDLDFLMEEGQQGYELPYPKIQESYRGIRKAELLLLTAGSGIGKSTLARELGYYLATEHKLRIGNCYLEESVKKTARGYVAIDHNVPLGTLMTNPRHLTKEQYQATKEKLTGRVFYYDHFGSLESDSLMDKLNYLAVGLQCDFIILDHISMVVADQEGSGEGERKDIDRLMTRLRSFIERTGVGVIAIVHLKRPGGSRRSFNEGGSISLSDLRGSASLEQLSDAIWALERNQQSEEDSDLSRVRGLKNRMFGDLGLMDTFQYNRETGRFLPVEETFGFDEPEGEQDF